MEKYMTLSAWRRERKGWNKMDHDQKEFNPQQEVQQSQTGAQSAEDQNEVNDMVKTEVWA